MIFYGVVGDGIGGDRILRHIDQRSSNRSDKILETFPKYLHEEAIKFPATSI